MLRGFCPLTTLLIITFIITESHPLINPAERVGAENSIFPSKIRLLKQVRTIHKTNGMKEDIVLTALFLLSLSVKKVIAQTIHAITTEDKL